MSELIQAAPAAIGISGQDADALLQSGDGDAALLYIYLLRSGGAIDLTQAAAALHRSGSDIRSAARCLQRLGLLAGGAPSDTPAPEQPRQDKVPLAPAPEQPQYTIQDITGDPAFRGMVRETETLLGRVLGDGETRRLFGIYREYAFPTEVMMLLIQYLMEQSAPGRQPGFKAIENEARFWYTNGGVRTYEDAERWLAELQRRHSLTAQILKVVGLTDRKPSKTERDYISAWIDMGYGPEALAEAYDRTVTKTGKLSWQYMDRIVRNWHDKNLHTLQEILAGDTRPGRKDAQPQPQAQAAISQEENDLALAQMERIMRDMRKNGRS